MPVCVAQLWYTVSTVMVYCATPILCDAVVVPVLGVRLYSVSDAHCTDIYSDNFIPEPLTLHTAVGGTVRPLLGSNRHGQAMLYLFQKHMFCWGYEYIVCRNEITYVKVKFYVFY